MRAPAVPLARRTAALADLASRIHGEISISFDPSVSEVYAVSFPDPITRKRMLRCFTRGEPYESIRDFVRFRRELQRGDRAAAIAALDGIIARGAGGYFERNARSERLLLVPLSAAARLAQWDSLNPPPPADASALRHAQYRRNRADAAGDPRAVLEAAREAFSIQRDVGGLVVPLLASDRPNEILLHLNPEITRLATGDTTPAAQLNAHRRMRFFQHRRSQAHWLLEDDAAMLSDAAAVLTDTAIVPATRRDALPYVLQGLLAMRDTAAWRGVFVRHEPDTPVARAGLLVSSMHFALTHGDTSIARAIAAEIARDYEPMLGQANVPEVLALSVAQAHRRLGRLDRAAELLRALDVSADASTVRAARLQLVRVAAQRGDEATLTSLTKWIEEELAEEDPAAALLGMARLRAVQRNPSEAWRHLEAYAARGFTRWHANIRLDPDLSRLKDYEPAQSFFRPRG